MLIFNAFNGFSQTTPAHDTRFPGFRLLPASVIGFFLNDDFSKCVILDEKRPNAITEALARLFLQNMEHESNPDYVVEVVSLSLEDSEKSLNNLATALKLS
ncbi:hypothetical protein L1987_69738 [Smallanthus sonchifolius]|uniref:Uncharacterized protein n=1 Tax=Smallanthus sonchifolius TaxID=185202 RepID=A0ACB9B5R1_9ASTR|nr:hypothetical protein L1987_69738 [Smallanthus sonchifolius]